MSVKNKIRMNELLKTKMTRKEFLLYIFTVFVALSGISKITEILANTSTKRVISRQTKGFGSHPYGI